MQLLSSEVGHVCDMHTVQSVIPQITRPAVLKTFFRASWRLALPRSKFKAESEEYSEQAKQNFAKYRALCAIYNSTTSLITSAVQLKSLQKVYKKYTKSMNYHPQRCPRPL